MRVATSNHRHITGIIAVTLVGKSTRIMRCFEREVGSLLARLSTPVIGIFIRCAYTAGVWGGRAGGGPENAEGAGVFATAFLRGPVQPKTAAAVSYYILSTGLKSATPLSILYRI